MPDGVIIGTLPAVSGPVSCVLSLSCSFESVTRST